MKTPLFTLIVGLIGLLAAQSQTNTPPPAQMVAPSNSVPVADTNSAPVAQMVASSNSVAPVETNTAPMIATDTNSTPATTDGQLVDATNGVTVGIPQIKFSDVPITTAIENLARLANINYMLDPKIGYGLPDANGQIKTEPVLSIRWENISAENALTALLENYGLQIIPDKHTGIARVTLKDPAAPPPLFTKVIQLKYASVLKLVESAQSVLTDKRSKVLTDGRTSQLIVVATDPEQQAVDTLVSQLDKPTRQVLIEARFIEISSQPTSVKGVNWTKTLQNQNVSFGNGNSQGSFTTTFPGTPGADLLGRPTAGGSSTTVGSIVNSVGSGGLSWNTVSGITPDIGFLNADGLSAVLSFLNSSSDAQVMATPRLVTLDNEAASISVTHGYPVINTTAGTANAAGGSQIAYTNVGTVLHVTPRISANDYIWLKVLPEISSFAGNFEQSVPNTGSSGGAILVSTPTFNSRTIETQVLIPNSNTLVMGGLVQDNPTVNSTKVPLMGDIPGLGFMFRSTSKSMNKDNLLIFITPTIVKDSDFQASTSANFLKSKPQAMKDPMNPRSAWDGPVPRGNWSDPVTDTTK
jgi:general secretion pathway protein D